MTWIGRDYERGDGGRIRNKVKSYRDILEKDKRESTEQDNMMPLIVMMEESNGK